jgi:hypothetical protein
MQQNVKKLEKFWPPLQRIPPPLCTAVSKGLDGGGEKVGAETDEGQMGKVGEESGERESRR